MAVCQCGNVAEPGDTLCKRCIKQKKQKERWRKRRKYETRTCSECAAKYKTTTTSNRSTCGRIECQRLRDRRKSRANAVKAKAAESVLFAGSSILCPVCGKTVQQTRSRQATCLSAECVKTWGNHHHKAGASRASAKRRTVVRDGRSIGAWGIEIDPWTAGTMPLENGVRSAMCAEMLPLM